jgi:hypothetical protein
MHHASRSDGETFIRRVRIAAVFLEARESGARDCIPALLCSDHDTSLGGKA